MKRVNVFLVSVSLIFLGLFMCGYFYNKSYHENIKLHPEMYAYQTYWGPANSVLIIEDLKYKDELVDYYSKIIFDTTSNPIIKVPLKTLPQYEPVYVVGYTNDSLLAEVVSYYDRGIKFGGNYLRGWVYVKTLHKNPPPR